MTVCIPLPQTLFTVVASTEVGRPALIAACRAGTGVDVMMGTGGTPEGIVTACAIKATGGIIQGRLAPIDDDERQRAIEAVGRMAEDRRDVGLLAVTSADRLHAGCP